MSTTTTTITPVDDYSPVFVGDTAKPLRIFVRYRAGGAVPLFDVSFSMRLENITKRLVKRCTGPWTVEDEEAGILSYAWQPNDVDTEGSWMIYITLTVDGKRQHTDPKPLEILHAPS